MSTSESKARPNPEELRAMRRAARIAGNRADILDAAERTFAEQGLSDGSVRDIAKQAGFSTAAIYKYFESKQHLLAEMLIRRGTQLLEVIDAAVHVGRTPMDKLHSIVDATVAFFETYPDFRQILRNVRESEAIIATVLTQYAFDNDIFLESLSLMTSILEDGQKAGEIRDGSPGALIHLYMTLVNEHVFLSAANGPAGALTLQQFHDVIDGALRRPRKR